jgi:hypothetical protein
MQCDHPKWGLRIEQSNSIPLRWRDESVSLPTWRLQRGFQSGSAFFDLTEGSWREMQL